MKTFLKNALENLQNVVEYLGKEKSPEGYMAKENIAKGYIDKATTRPEGRSLRAPKWDEAKNLPKGISARIFSTRRYINQDEHFTGKFGQRVHQQEGLRPEGI